MSRGFAKKSSKLAHKEAKRGRIVIVRKV